MTRSKNKKGYTTIPLGTTRRMVIASVNSNKKNAIHCMTQIDITVPRKRIREYFEQTGTKLSFTAYIVKCFAETIKDHPNLNSFIKGRKIILLDDINISVLIEREIDNQKIPEPLGLHHTDRKSVQEITAEIREAQQNKGNELGDLGNTRWIRLIPPFLMRTFIRIADRNITMAKRYGKIAVTAVGMNSKSASWFIPHGTATVLLTVGSFENKVVEVDGKFVTREHLCLTTSFDHEIVDGSPAGRFMKQFAEIVESSSLL